MVFAFFMGCLIRYFCARVHAPIEICPTSTVYILGIKRGVCSVYILHLSHPEATSIQTPP